MRYTNDMRKSEIQDTSTWQYRILKFYKEDI